MSQVQAASLTFTIGDIFIPGTKADDLGGCNNPRASYELAQGHTAVIRTRETIHLSARRAGIGFPPAFQSLKGLLMTNPGHIDPGYNGPLHCTVINMAHRSFHLERGDHIMRVLLFELPANYEPTAPYYARAGLGANEVGRSPITEELLDRLSIDFVDVERRSVSAAETQINKAQLRALWIPVAVAVVTGIIAAGGSYYTSTLAVKEDVIKLRDEFIQAKSGLENKDMIFKLENDITVIKDDLKQIRDSSRATNTPRQNANP